MIGEMRDAETIDTAMKAAETGHLLISTLHTPDAQSTIMRMMAMFPPEEQEVVRIRLAESLHAVVSQRLLPRADGQRARGGGEVMINTPTIRDLILENRMGRSATTSRKGASSTACRRSTSTSPSWCAARERGDHAGRRSRHAGRASAVAAALAGHGPHVAAVGDEAGGDAGGDESVAVWRER
jgi:hypothetical protein